MPRRDNELYTTPRRSPRLLQAQAPKESDQARVFRRRFASEDRRDSPISRRRVVKKDISEKVEKCCSESVSKKKKLRKRVEVLEEEVSGNRISSRNSRVSRDETQKSKRSPRIADLSEDHPSSKIPRIVEGFQTPRRSTRLLTNSSSKSLIEDRSGIVKAQNFISIDSKSLIQKRDKPLKTTEVIEGYQMPRRSTRALTQLSEKTTKAQNFVSSDSKHRRSISGRAKPSKACEIIEGFQTPRRSTRLLSAENFVEQRSIIERSSEPEDEEDKSRAVEANRKRKRSEIDDVAVHGWSKEQESALQKAYLIAKPTPQFWKKVSKLVPGKSAQECFEKLNSDYATPPHRRRVPKSTIENKKSPISASEILKLTKNPKQRKKQPIQNARKKARHLLQEQNNHHHHHSNNQAFTRADLFSILEPDLNFEVSTPKHKESLLLKKLAEISSSSGSLKKSRSRFSPPVLKTVKDKALHEKYIDQLHMREARRKTAFQRAKKFSADDDGDRRICDPVRDAKNALISEARDAIDALRRVRSDIDDDSSDFECDFRGDESEIET